MSQDNDGQSFYFFDVDDNILFLTTPIFLLNTETNETKAVSTGEFALVHPQLGRSGDWENYSIYDGSYKNFRDIDPELAEKGEKQYFVQDVEKAISSGSLDWQAPSWKLFVYACEKQRPVSLVTARGHSPDTLKAGIRLLVENGLLPKEPNYHTIFPVGNDDVRKEHLDDLELTATTPLLKKRAIIKTVKKAVEEYGDHPHRFGMSDDDPKNVDLIIRAMCDCKKMYLDQRFFVVNTHVGEMVKLEVFPVDYPATGRHSEDGEVIN